MKSRDEVLGMVQIKMRLRHFALCTERAYLNWVGRYYDFCLGRSRAMSHEQKAEAFLTELAVVRRISARTQNQALCALNFLYGEVLGRPLGGVDGLRARQVRHERTAPSREQIRAFRSAVMDRDHTPGRLLVDLLYGCGLRVSEPLELRVKDVLWGENQLVVRAAKGGKDRRVPIPRVCAEPLREQLKRAREVWEEDRARHSAVGVSLPFCLAQKYPKAPFAWQWFWVFPAPGHCRDPYSGQTVHYHLLHDSLQRLVHDAAVKVGLEGILTPHVLRHAYAMHSGENLDVLRELMGHASIETTAGYRHPVVASAGNPLDDLLSEVLG